MKKGKIFKAAVAFLLFAVILLAGCNKESNYPETVEDMQKLLEANEAEFEEFAQLVLANVPEDVKEMRLAYTQSNQWSFYLEYPEDPSGPKLKNISSLENSKEIRAFLKKYSVLNLYAIQNYLSFGIFKPSLAGQHSSWFNLTSDIFEFGRYYRYSPSGEFTEDDWGYVNEYWCATSNADIK